MSPRDFKFAGLAGSLFLTMSIPLAAQAEEVVIDGRTYHVVIAVPAHGAPLPEPPPPPKTLEEALADLTEQNRQLALSIRQLSGSIDRRAGQEDKASSIYGLGAGLLVTTGQAQFALDANLKYVFACYYPGKGECLGAVSTIEDGNVKYHPLGFGIFRYDDRNDPLSAEFLPRGWDFMVTTGLDVRLREKLYFRFQTAWFFPNPFDVERYAQDRIEEDLAEWERRHNRNVAAAEKQAAARNTAAPQEFIEAEKENTRDMRKAMSRHTAEASGSYKKAGHKPWFQLALRWEF